MPTSLDGITLLRYAHMYRNRISGGAEQYLQMINRALLERHRMTILQMYLEPGPPTNSTAEAEVEKHGLGTIVWLPVRIHSEAQSIQSIPRRLKMLGGRPGGAFVKRQPFARTVQRALANSCGHLRYQNIIVSETLLDHIDTRRVDLTLFHWLSYDVGSLISHLAKRRIPYGVVHHFNNVFLGQERNRRSVAQAAAVGGVSAHNAPAGLRDDFVNLSDAVDPEAFSLERVQSLQRDDRFTVGLAGRIAEGKGHNDLLEALQRLVDGGIDMKVAFAGAIESVALELELRAKVRLMGLQDRVTFAGELSQEKLRNWYAASDVVVLPSRSEGLGRVLIEAQAMERPVVGYDAGGMPDALVPGETGFLVPSDDIAALSERLQWLHDNPDRRRAMGAAGRQFVLRQFSPSALVARHEHFYLKVLSADAKRDAHGLAACPA